MTSITERFYELHPTSRKLYEERSKGLFPDGVTHETRFLAPFPIYATHAQGPRKWDVDGNEYVDYVSGHGALLLGHSHPAVVSAVTEQVSKGTHLGANTELELKWGELVTRLIPSAEKVRFTSSGTEATLMAMRLARAYTGKSKIIKFFDHFHGWHDYAMANGNVSGPGIPAETWESMIVLPEVNDIAAVEKALDENDDVAAIILEPTGAHMGVSPIHPSFLEELRELTNRREIVLIFDEVVTGFRSSPGGAQARFGITPDMTSLAKILGGGLPGGAVAGKSGYSRHDTAPRQPGLGHGATCLASWHLQRQPDIGGGRRRGARPGCQHQRQRPCGGDGDPAEGRGQPGDGSAGDTGLRLRSGLAGPFDHGHAGGPGDDQRYASR